MLDREFAKGLVLRWTGLRGFPVIKEAVGELITAMQTAPPTQEAAQMFVSDWNRSSEEAPKPVNIYQAFQRDATTSERSGCPNPKCEEGWEIVYRPDGTSGARPCNACRAPAPATAVDAERSAKTLGKVETMTLAATALNNSRLMQSGSKREKGPTKYKG